MDKELYLIHLEDYLDHIDDKLDMYELMLELVRALRNNLTAGEFSKALRTLCSYEQKAHEMYEDWRIPDEYTESGDTTALSQLMEDELLPADEDEGVDADEDEDCDKDDIPFMLGVQFGRVYEAMRQSADSVTDFCQQLAGMELEAIDRVLAKYEKSENDCAG